MHEYVGAIHIHSVFSDGSGEIPDIAQQAGECGLDYILMTDHNTLRGLEEGYEKWYGNTLALIGFEINDRINQNHYIAFNVNKTYSTRIPAAEYVKAINDDGGFGFIAHPHETRSSLPEHPPYPWTDWHVQDYTGIEIWNHMSEWMEGLTEQNKLNYFLHPLKSIIAPSKETLAVWDEVNKTRKVVGIGGVDAHAHKVNVLGFFEFEVFAYKVLFKSIRTHILTNEPLIPSAYPADVEKGKNNIYSALKSGCCFTSFYYRGDAAGFRFYAEDNGKEFQMGETVKMTGKTRLHVSVPSETGVIKLIYNGQKTEEIENSSALFQVDKPGVYRVEVYQNNYAWIFSNHIRIEQ